MEEEEIRKEILEEMGTMPFRELHRIIKNCKADYQRTGNVELAELMMMLQAEINQRIILN
jgi:hypothetical protein